MNGYEILVAAHVIGVAFSVGAVTVGDMLFFRAVKQRRLTRHGRNLENRFADCVTGPSSFFFPVFCFCRLPTRDAKCLPLAFTAKFWLKMTIVGVLFINGLFMHWKAIQYCRKLSKRADNFVRRFSVSGASLRQWRDFSDFMVCGDPLGSDAQSFSHILARPDPLHRPSWDCDRHLADPPPSRSVLSHENMSAFFKSCLLRMFFSVF